MDEWIEHQGGADNIVVGGAQRFHLDCNWKMVFDNAGDGYHPPFSHQSLLQMTSARYGGWLDDFLLADSATARA